MKPQMKHSSSMKSKNNAQIHMLQNDLFSKLDTVEPIELKLNDMDFKMIEYPQDSLSELIGRAKGIVHI